LGRVTRLHSAPQNEDPWEQAATIRARIRPPTFVLFTSRAAHRALHFSEERFLINQLRKRFGFQGTPVVIKLKNPRR